MVRIIKAGRNVRVHKGVLIYIRTDGSIRAELIEEGRVVFIAPDEYICAIFISEEVRRWRQ